MTTRSIFLSTSHRQALHARSLTDATIAAAGFYTVTSPAAAGKLLNWPSDGPAPALVIPYPGHPGLSRLRPDHPRSDKTGKTIKYESPRDSNGHLYIAAQDESLRNIAQRLIITESEFKALAISQLGYPAIGTAGVWGFHDVAGHRENRNWRLHSDFADIPLQGRTVYIAFDSDAVENAQVLYAEAVLARMLNSAGANVRIVRIPASPDGRKQGADDFLAASGTNAHTAFGKLLNLSSNSDLASLLPTTSDNQLCAKEVEELLTNVTFTAGLYAASEATYQIIANRLKKEHGISAAMLKNIVAAFRKRLSGMDNHGTHNEYEVVDGCTYAIRNGVRELIAECAMEITEISQIENGANMPEASFRLRVSAPHLATKETTVSPAQLEDARTIVSTLEAATGEHLRILPRRERDLIDAIHALSRPVRRRLFGTTGWARTDDGEHVYVLPRGCVTRAGLAKLDVAIDIAELTSYGFDKTANGGGHPFAGILDLLNAGQAEVTVLLVGQALLAPLIPHLGGRKPLVHLRGYSGVFKSEMLKQVRRLQGVPASVPLVAWTSTVNALERLIHLGKDLLIIIDDFKAALVPPPVWLRLLQNYGDSTARSRMTKELGSARTYVPRALVVTAGEEIPEGQRSAISRLLIVNAQKGWMTSEALTSLQTNPTIEIAGQWWIQHLAGSQDDLSKNFESEIIAWRGEFANRLGSVHARTPDGLAPLMAMYARLFAAIAHDCKVDFEECQQIAFDALLAVGRDTAKLTSVAAPGRRFLDALASMFQAFEARLVVIGTVPSAAWNNTDGVRVGWVTKDEIWLDPEQAFNVVESHLRRSGRSLGMNRDGIAHALSTEGLLKAQESDHHTCRRLLFGKRVRVLVFDPAAFDGASEDLPAVAQGTGRGK